MLRKIYRKFFKAAATSTPKSNLLLGHNCSVHPTAIIETGKNGAIELMGNNYIGCHVEIGAISKIEIGFNTSIQDRCIILGDVDIGNYCTFAPNVYISSGRHYYNLKPNYYIKDQDELVANDKILSNAHSKKVTIGDDCWLGINSVIMSGLTIGRGCVIGANAVVTKNLEPFSVVAGAPAKLIKSRLNFIPKTNLLFSEENDLPNFYKGFLIDQNNLNKYNLMGGIAATTAFTFYLIDTAKKIKLTLKKITDFPLAISYNQQEIKIENEDFITLVFDALNQKYHSFVVSDNIDKHTPCFIVKSIEILNETK